MKVVLIIIPILVSLPSTLPFEHFCCHKFHACTCDIAIVLLRFCHHCSIDLLNSRYHCSQYWFLPSSLSFLHLFHQCWHSCVSSNIIVSTEFLSSPSSFLRLLHLRWHSCISASIIVFAHFLPSSSSLVHFCHHSCN